MLEPVKDIWTEERLAALNHLRYVLCDMCIMTVPRAGDVFSLHTDASAADVGGVLNVGVERPVGFFSKQLQGEEKRYSATELEGLAVVRVVAHFAPYHYGNEFAIVTDHRTLVTMFTGKSQNRRIHGWALSRQDYSFEVVYRKGAANGNADGLSRQAWNEDGNDDATEDGSRLTGGEMWGGGGGGKPH